MSVPAVLPPNPSRAVWLKNLHRWHWISAALSLLGMLLFSLTGITLNHASQIEAKPSVTRSRAQLPEALRPQLVQAALQHVNVKAGAALPPAVAGWVKTSFGLEVAALAAEWSEDDAYLAMPRPGGDAWLRIATDGAAEYEVTSRGAISWLNDMHKGRNAGTAWSWFIDLFGVACLVFCVTGFLILKLHAANRPATWPVIGFGMLLPIVLALLFVH